MISNKLKNILALSVFIFISHGLEEYFTGFYKNDSHVAFMFGWLVNMPKIQGLFLLFQIMLWFLLIVSYLLLLGPKWQLRPMFVLGFVFIYELHHLYKAIVTAGYYPGILTALPLYVVGFFFWKELLKSTKNKFF